MTLPFMVGYVLGEHGRQSARLAAQSGARSGAPLQDLMEAEQRIDRLTLIVAAMWSLLEETGLTTDRLQERIQILDQSDGVADGRLTPTPSVCSSCGAKVAPGLAACQFCGEEVAADARPGPFDTL